MLKIGKSDILGALKTSLITHKKPINENETNFCNITLRNIHNDAIKSYTISTITLGNQRERSENAEDGQICQY